MAVASFMDVSVAVTFLFFAPNAHTRNYQHSSLFVLIYMISQALGFLVVMGNSHGYLPS